VPQTVQKWRFLPGEDSKARSLSSPLSQLNFSRGTRAVGVKRRGVRLAAGAA
jgi:hypothetical protein